MSTWAQMTPRQQEAAAAADAHRTRKQLRGGQHATTRGQCREVIRQITAERLPFSPGSLRTPNQGAPDMARTITKLGRDLRIGDQIVYDETFLGRLRTAPIREIHPDGQRWLRLVLTGAGEMHAETKAPYTVIA